jgi:hypothetical protein
VLEEPVLDPGHDDEVDDRGRHDATLVGVIVPIGVVGGGGGGGGAPRFVLFAVPGLALRPLVTQPDAAGGGAVALARQPRRLVLGGLCAESVDKAGVQFRVCLVASV